MKLKREILLELKRTIRFFAIHPETEPNSEMQDRMESLIELENKIENINE